MLPPPDEAGRAILALERYIHGDTGQHPLIDCALIHYQFETIHPFLDGNGRVGRLLIPLYLHSKGLLDQPVLYISYFLKIHVQEYFDRLMLVRERGNYEQWVDFFLEAVAWTAKSALETMKSILALREECMHRLLLEPRAAKSSLHLLDRLFLQPIATIRDVARILHMTVEGASAVVRLLVDLDILLRLLPNWYWQAARWRRWICTLLLTNSP